MAAVTREPGLAEVIAECDDELLAEIMAGSEGWQDKLAVIEARLTEQTA